MSDGNLRTIFRERLPRLHWQSIETAMTGGGVPDSNYCADGVEGWLEYKATTGWAVTLRPAQIGWIARRVRAGGRVYVAVRQQGAGRDNLWLFHGRHVKDARVDGLRGTWARAAASWHEGPQCWNWKAVERALLERAPLD